MAQSTYDYIIIGAGSAGNVLAARLTEDPNVRVLLLEAGLPDYRLDFRTQMPAALAMPLQGTTYNWGYKTDPEPHMDNRRMDCGRGKGLGGSSLINGMCYIRGNALDFDHWAKKDGLADWRYHDVLPYFRKAECRDIGPNAYHGGHGPIEVTTAKPATNPLFEAMIEAGVQAGYPRTDDLNGYQQEGFGPMDRFVTRQGRRASTARGYLDMARERSGLVIQSRALVDTIVFEGTRAVGVRYQIDGGAFQTANASREILLCGGAIASPQILQRSGVGPGEWLKEAGVKEILDLPGVGNNLQDHLELYMQYECLQPVSIAPANLWYNKPPIGVEWMFKGTGLGATNHFEAGGFIRSDEKFTWPNIQYHFLPSRCATTAATPPRPTASRLTSAPCAHPAAAACASPAPTRRNTPASSSTTCPTRRTGKSSAPPSASPATSSASRRWMASGAKPSPPPTTCRATPSWTPTSGSTPRPPTTPPAPAPWAKATTPWWTARDGSTGWKGCAWWMPRSCRTSSPATSTPPPS